MKWQSILLVSITVVFLFGAISPRAYGWNVAAYPSSRTTVPGGTVTYSVSVFYQPSDPSLPPVSLLISPSVAGVSVSFSPENGTMSFNSLMTVHVDGSKAIGTYTLNIWAHPASTPFPGEDSKMASVLLVVQSAMSGSTDFALSDASLSPASPHVGDPVTFQVVITALTSNQPYPQSMTLVAQLDGYTMGGGTVDYPGPTGNPVRIYSTPPWTATAGTHTITWRVTSGLQDPNTSNNQASLTFTVGQTSQQFDFSVWVSPLERTVTNSGSVSYTVTVTLVSGPSQTVTLSAIGEPASAIATFSKPSGKPTFSSSLTLTVAPSTSIGTYTLVVTGSGGGITRSATLTLIVGQVPDFNLQVNPPSLTVGQGQVGSYSVEVVGTGGFNSPVSLSVSGLPQGVGSVFSAKSGTPYFVSILTVTLPNNVQTGSFALTIKGAGGGLTRTTSTILVVTQFPYTQTLTQTRTQTFTSTQTHTLTSTQTQIVTETSTETGTQVQTQTETKTETTYVVTDLLDVLQKNSLVIIGVLALIIIILAASAFRRR